MDSFVCGAYERTGEGEVGIDVEKVRDSVCSMKWWAAMKGGIAVLEEDTDRWQMAKFGTNDKLKMTMTKTLTNAKTMTVTNPNTMTMTNTVTMRMTKTLKIQT